MAAPAFVQASAGTVITGTSGTVSLTGCTADNFIIYQELNDGTGTNFVPNTISNITLLNGSGTGLTDINTPDIEVTIGNPRAAQMYLYCGRVTADGTVSLNSRPNAGDDTYCRIYEFSGVHTGTTLSDVIENSSAGTAADEAGTGTSVSDVGVTTLGSDRLACNFVGINDDATGFAAFTGMSGGTWALPVAIFESATGTDATIALVTATIASAGTINGGSDTITSDGWGVRGFALIPAAAAAPTSFPAIQQPIPAGPTRYRI